MTRGPSSGPLPRPPASFSRKKERILAALAVPDGEYSDASPKGTVDEGIRALIGDINALDGFVTTSSCAGRACVFVEGRKARKAGGGDGRKAGVRRESYDDDEEEDDDEGEEEGGSARYSTIAAVGGKGGGGTWLFVSHDPVVVESGADVKDVLGLRDAVVDSGAKRGDVGAERTPEDTRLVHFKFEPMILHVLTASPEHAQLLLRAGLQAGFRESGAINVAGGAEGGATPMVAIRSMGLSLESLIGVRDDGGNGGTTATTRCTVSDDYLRSLVRVANDRFEENGKRIGRFRAGILDAGCPSKNNKVGDDGAGWEDAGARRERKRAEGLRRKAELRGQGRQGDMREGGGGGDVDLDLDFPLNTEFR